MPQHPRDFSFFLTLHADSVAAMTIRIADTTLTEQVMVSFADKKIKKVDRSENDINIKAVEAVD